ncbi:aldo/keto reductase [Sinorhizobium meliloti]|uniref:Aldo/keto reductase n=1 Tax=Sinorhizobium medicae TaxID=110321 RepID=A0A508WRD8_9HYPH|nr:MULTISPECIES: aldo/keto reductase [Sinorhizobium]ASQ06055.1 aldo/keto reductase [Sinorhizobium meliloti]MDE3832102.1 aldo/keto reductase [Sinorhizobium meliloti]MDE4580225.1 aldo/keto reductase [Sinorhizobium meliloti]MDW9488318.1 aldo/keto reductase [Sinorhizobium meliloti]MDW9558739.1 aldo/keto reductase [Sinorhizobium meliloti]
MTNRRTSEMGRRGFLSTAGSLAATPLLVGTGPQASAQETAQGTGVNSTASKLSGRRKLGLLEVSSLGLGVQNMHRTYQTTIPSRPEMINIIRTAHERGVTFFDTAEAYGPHECERILGEAIAPFRDKVVITSKFGWNIDLETGERRPGLNSRPERIKLAVEGMLKRLRTDRIDLLYQHRVDPEVPVEDVAGAVKDLMDQGKILHWGLSEMGLDTLRRAHAALPVTAVQNEYSVLWRGPEDQVIPVCEELGIGFVPWSPLGVGFLTGAIDERTRFAEGDIRGIETRFSPENLPANLTLVKLLGDWADRKQATAAQIALAWVMAQKPWIVPIPGTTQMPHMLENIGAASISFTPEEIDELNSAVAAIKVRGQRLPDAVLAFSNVEAPEKK